MTGTALLKMKAQLAVSSDIEISRIEDDLADLERELGIRITIRKSD
jgi:hypothetical protein